MEKCIRCDSVSNLEDFINSYLARGYKFKTTFQTKGEYKNNSEVVVYYTTYIIFIEP